MEKLDDGKNEENTASMPDRGSTDQTAKQEDTKGEEDEEEERIHTADVFVMRSTEGREGDDEGSSSIQ